MINSANGSIESNFGPEHDQFEVLGDFLLGVMQLNAFHWEEQARILAELAVAKEKLESGKLAGEASNPQIDKMARVNLFDAQASAWQSLDTNTRTQLVNNLCESFASLTGQRVASYNEIRAETLELVKYNRFFQEMSPAVGLLREGNLAVLNGDTIAGIKLPISENTFVIFNFGELKQVDDNEFFHTRVDVYVAGSLASL